VIFLIIYFVWELIIDCIIEKKRQILLIEKVGVAAAVGIKTGTMVRRLPAAEIQKNSQITCTL